MCAAAISGNKLSAPAARCQRVFVNCGTASAVKGDDIDLSWRAWRNIAKWMYWRNVYTYLYVAVWPTPQETLEKKTSYVLSMHLWRLEREKDRKAHHEAGEERSREKKSTRIWWSTQDSVNCILKLTNEHRSSIFEPRLPNRLRKLSKNFFFFF